MTLFPRLAKRGCIAVSNAAKQLEGFVDRLLPATAWMRGALITIALMSLYASFNAWARLTGGPIDFATYDLAAASFLNGATPYGTNPPHFQALAAEMGIEQFALPYFYPPLTAVLVAPLTLLPFAVAGWIWNLANAGAVVAATALLLGEKRWNAEGLLVWAITALFIPVLTTLNTGQVNGLLYLTVAFAIYAHERNQPMRAGAAIAFGALIKVTPVVLIGYLLWRGDWRAVLGAVLGAAVIVIATLPIAGLDSWFQYFTVGIGTLHDTVAYPPNFTLKGMFLRLLTENEWTTPLFVAPRLVDPLWIGSVLAIVGLTVAACWPPLRNEGPIRFDVALILVAVQLIAPFTWYHQLTASLLPACVIGLIAWRSGRFGSCWFGELLGVVVLIDVFGRAWHQMGDNAVLLSVPLLALLALWAAWGVAVVRRRVEPSEAADSLP